MAVHRALFVSEIITLIFEGLLDEKSTLADCAQTCRIFSGPALDVLWKELDSIHPLQELLPVVFKRGTSKSQDQTDRKIEWDRFDHYAYRVQKLGPDVFAQGWEMSSFYCRIQSIRRDVLSFPQLRGLKLWEDPQYPIIAAPMLPSSLRVLHVSFNSAFRQVPTVPTRPGDLFLRSAACDALGLIHLVVSGDVPSTSLIFVVKFFEDIRCIDLAHIRYTARKHVFQEVIQALSTKPKLHVAYFPSTCLADSDIPRCKGFGRLRALDTSEHPSAIMSMIDNITSPDFRGIGLKKAWSDPPATLDDWRVCFNTICTRFASTLRSIYVRVHAVNDGLTLIETVKPLLELRLMEEVAIFLPIAGAEVGDVQSIATAWPNLKAFRLGPRIQVPEVVEGADEQAPSAFRCLSVLARGCLNLITLEIRIDQNDLPDLSSVESVSHGLRTLDLDVNCVNDCMQLARILYKIFPEVQDVEVNKEINRRYSYDGPWDDVPVFIKQLQGKWSEGSETTSSASEESDSSSQ